MREPALAKHGQVQCRHGGRLLTISTLQQPLGLITHQGHPCAVRPQICGTEYECSAGQCTTPARRCVTEEMLRWRLPCVGLLLFAGLCPPFVCGLEAPIEQQSSSAAEADLSAAQSAVATQAVSVQGVGQVTVAADAVAAAVQHGAAGAPRKHKRRKRLSFAMAHRPRPEGLAAQTPVMNGIGLRQPAAPPLPQRRCQS